MVSTELLDIVRHAMGEHLERVPAPLLAPLKLPFCSVDFLSAVGVPREEILLCRWEFSAPQPCPAGRAKFVTRVVAPGPLWCVGTDGGCRLCLEEGTGRVFAVDPEAGCPSRFVASSAEQMVLLLALYRQRGVEVATAPDAEADRITGVCLHIMERLAPEAFDDANAWWPAIREQMRDGFL